MLEARNEFDQNIWWEHNCGHSIIWFDNWTQLGGLHYYLPINRSTTYPLDEVNQLMSQGGWNAEVLQQLFHEDVCNHILKIITVVETLKSGYILVDI